MVKQWNMVGNLIVDGEGYAVAQIQNHNHAKLIAAAPELLEALATIIENRERDYLDCDIYPYSLAKEAIKKATS